MLKLKDIAGTKVGDLKKMFKETEESLGLVTEDAPVDKNTLRQLIAEEYVAIQKAQKAHAPVIAKKLEKMREELFPLMLKRERQGANFLPALERRMQIDTVATLIDEKVNDLMIYCINEIQSAVTSNEHGPIGYRQRQIIFYAN